MTTQNSKTRLSSEPSASVRGIGALLWAIGATSIVLVLSWLQFSVQSICCGEFDGYYHIRWSRLLWEGLRHGHLPAFTWLPLTALNASRYADQHFLYHLLLIPFTWFADLSWGAKLGTVLFASAAVFSLYWLILRYRIRYPLLWLLALLACSWAFYYRMSMTRASAVSILFIVAGIFLLFERKYVWLGPVAFLYVWTYNLFVMLGVLVVIWAVVAYWSERRIEWRPILWTCLGTIAGFVIHPYFPRNAKLFFEHLAAKSGSTSAQTVVGREWYSIASWQFLNDSMVACAAMVVGYIAFGSALAGSRSDRRKLQRPLLFLLFSSFLLLISLRFTRFLEYWPPFAILFAAFTLETVWSNQSVVSSPLAEKNPEEDVASLNQSEGLPWKTLGFIAVLLSAVLAYNLRTARTSIIAATKPAGHYQAATNWMHANIPPDALIYNFNWSDFPKLFFYDTSHRYVSGLDPIYLLDQHPELSRLDDRLSHGSEPNPAAAISTQFAAVDPSGVSYLFIGDYPTPPPPEWFRYIMAAGQFAIIYRDSDCVILQVLYRPPSQGPVEEIRQLDSPDQRRALLPEVQRRFKKGNIFGTDEENWKGGPALVIHNQQATQEWANRLFTNDANSISGEELWQLGFHFYVVTNGKDAWVTEVKGNPKYRSAFSAASDQTPK